MGYKKSRGRLKVRIAWWPNSRSVSVASFRLRCLRAHTILLERGYDSFFYREEDPPPDVLCLCKRYDPKSLNSALKLRSRHGTRLVLEICDNHFYFDAHQDIEGILSARAVNLRDAISQMDLVVTSSDELAKIVVRECPQASGRVVVIQDFLEHAYGTSNRFASEYLHSRLQIAFLKKWLARTGAPQKERRLIWFGSHGSPGVENGMADISLIRQELVDSHRNYAPLSLTIVSNSREKYDKLFKQCDFPTYYVNWHSMTIDLVLQLHGTAVIPVSISPFSVCKTANRIVTCVQNKLSIVASCIPSYLEFKDAVILDDWSYGLRDFCSPNSVDTREQMHLVGMQVIDQTFSDNIVFTKWVDAILEVVDSGRVGARLGSDPVPSHCSG